MAKGIVAAIMASCASIQAEPTHQLVTPFETSAGGQFVSLPVGTEVEALPGDGKTFMVRHTLPSGSVTLLFIPVQTLTPIAKTNEATKTSQAAEPATSPIPEVPPLAASPSSPAPTSAPTGKDVRLSTADGQTAEGQILRLEKRYVVIWNGQDPPVDLPLKSLDKPSEELLAKWDKQSMRRTTPPDPRIVPGQTFDLIFPDIGASRSSNPTRIQIRIPENYDSDKLSPIALYLGGGEGNDKCDPLNQFVDRNEWILVAFPYPSSAPRPLDAYRDGKSDDLISFQEPMLERLQAILPNTDPERRVVIGSSNGAHMIGIASCDGWKEFVDYFSGFVLHEGGGSKSRDFSALRRKKVILLMGAKSEGFEFAEGIEDRLKKARVKAEIFVADEEGHGMGNASRETIKNWIAKLPTK